ncbi:MAG: NAD-dependent epimerase/dehydratase family protein [Halobacteriales archaeon]
MPTDETVLITGGTGFIGSYVTATLLDRGHDVVCYDVSTDTSILDHLDITDEVTIYPGDVADPTDVDRAINRNDVTRIIHLAALLTPAARADPRRAIDVNIRGATTALEAARTFDSIERVVLASSETVYAPLSAYGTDTAREDAIVDPQSIYAAAKLYNERQVDVYAEEYDVPAVSLRPTGVYGPYRGGDESGVFRHVIEQGAVGKDVTVEDGDLSVSWLYVRDAARAFVDAAMAPETDLTQRVYNIPGDVATLREVAELVETLVPETTMTVHDGGEEWSAQALDPTAARSDYGYEIEYDLRRGVTDYINTIRRAHDLATVNRA